MEDKLKQIGPSDRTETCEGIMRKSRSRLIRLCEAEMWRGLAPV